MNMAGVQSRPYRRDRLRITGRSLVRINFQLVGIVVSHNLQHDLLRVTTTVGPGTA
jgi:hypothetical protein